MSDRNREVSSTIMNAVNGSFSPSKTAEAMCHEHRTLQQNFTRLCVEWLKVLSTSKMYDDRNYASVKLAKDLMQVPEVKDLIDRACLPFI